MPAYEENRTVDRQNSGELPQTFREFYPVYLRGHSHPMNRAVHFVGAIGVVTAAITAIAWGQFWIFLAAVPLTYAVLWASHVTIEKNVPVTLHGGWKPVVMSMGGEFYMTWRFLTGRLGKDLERFGIRPLKHASQS